MVCVESAWAGDSEGIFPHPVSLSHALSIPRAAGGVEFGCRRAELGGQAATCMSRTTSQGELVPRPPSGSRSSVLPSDGNPTPRRQRCTSAARHIVVMCRVITSRPAQRHSIQVIHTGGRRWRRRMPAPHVGLPEQPAPRASGGAKSSACGARSNQTGRVRGRQG